MSTRCPSLLAQYRRGELFIVGELFENPGSAQSPETAVPNAKKDSHAKRNKQRNQGPDHDALLEYTNFKA